MSSEIRTKRREWVDKGHQSWYNNNIIETPFYPRRSHPGVAGTV